jgi:acylphosphatase
MKKYKVEDLYVGMKYIINNDTYEIIKIDKKNDMLRVSFNTLLWDVFISPLLKSLNDGTVKIVEQTEEKMKENFKNKVKEEDILFFNETIQTLTPYYIEHYPTENPEKMICARAFKILQERNKYIKKEKKNKKKR